MVVEVILITAAAVTAGVLVVQVAVLPLVFKYSKSMQRQMVFSTCVNFPRNLDYDNPETCDVVAGSNFQVEFQSKVDHCPVKLGTWHMAPRNAICGYLIPDTSNVKKALYNELKRTKNPVVLYCHGNSNNRASPHRRAMYKIWQELNFHVIAFDYRGYGDSSRVRPTERGVVEDALHEYAWLLDALPQPRPMVLLWGHSLGTAVVSNLVCHLAELCEAAGCQPLPPPDGILLEAPFNNLADEITKHPASKLFSWLPYYHHSFVVPFKQFELATDRYLCAVPDIPVLMLHSKCDRIVPYELAVKLHETVNESRRVRGAPLVFHTFEKTEGIGHNNICDAPELKNIIGDFVELIKKREPAKFFY